MIQSGHNSGHGMTAAVMPCAKLWPDLITIFSYKRNTYFHKVFNLLVKWGHTNLQPVMEAITNQ